MANLLSWGKKKLDAAYHGINPLDNGQGWTSVAPPPSNLQRAQQSIANANQQLSNARYGVLAQPQQRQNFIQSQAQGNQFNPLAASIQAVSHNPVTNAAGAGVKFIPQFSANYANTFGNLGARLAGGKNQTIQQNLNDPFSRRVVQLSGATGTNRQLASDAAQIGLSIGAGAIGKAIEPLVAGAVGVAAPRAAQDAITLAGLGLHQAPTPVVSNAIRYGTNALEGGLVNAGFNAAGTAGEKGASVKDVAKSLPLGFGTGVVFGAGGTAAGDLAKTVLSNAKKNMKLVSADYSSKTPKNLNKGAFTKADQAKLNKMINVEAAGKSLPKDVPTKQPKLDLGENIKQNPQIGTVPYRHVLPGDSGQAHLNADFVANHERAVGGAAQAELTKLSSADQELLKSIQSKGVQAVANKAENPAQFTRTAEAIRNYYDLRHAYDHSLGITTPYRKNYLRDILDRNIQSGENFAATGGSKRPGYILPKTKELNTNVAEALQKDINGASFNHAKLTYAQGLEEAFPNSISRGSPIVGKEGVTQQLHTLYGNELFATKDVARGINKRAITEKATGALGAYDKANAAAKYVKLAGGAFHAVTEAGNFVGQQLVSGKLFREPGSTAKVFRTFFSNKALRSETSKLIENGTMDKAKIGGLTWTPEAIKADVNITPTGKVAKYTGIKFLHDATFKREIPYMKLKTFEQRTQGLDINNPADVAKIRAIAKAVNAEFGGINRAVEGVGPQNAKRWSRILLASDFTESKITTLRNAIIKGGEEGKLAREVVVGKALLFGGLATVGGIVGGEFKNKNTNDTVQGITNKILDPSFNFGSYKVSLPATHLSEFTKPFKSFGDDSKDKFSGLKHYATARLAALPSEVNQLINNQDYRGQKIYSGTKTKPISGSRAALNVASGVLPIPFSQGASAATGQQSTPSAIANIVGLRSYQTTPKKTATTANSEAATLKLNPPKGYSLQQADDGKYVYNLDGEIKTTKDLKIAQRAIAMDSFKSSDKQELLTKDRYYYKDSSGDVHYMSLDSFNKKRAAMAKKTTRVKSSGSRTASRKGVGALASTFKLSSKTVSLPKDIKVAKAKTFKAPKTRKLAVSKIPSNYVNRKLA